MRGDQSCVTNGVAPHIPSSSTSGRLVVWGLVLSWSFVVVDCCSRSSYVQWVVMVAFHSKMLKNTNSSRIFKKIETFIRWNSLSDASPTSTNWRFLHKSLNFRKWTHLFCLESTSLQSRASSYYLQCFLQCFFQNFVVSTKTSKSVVKGNPPVFSPVPNTELILKASAVFLVSKILQAIDLRSW